MKLVAKDLLQQWTLHRAHLSQTAAIRDVKLVPDNFLTDVILGQDFFEQYEFVKLRF